MAPLLVRVTVSILAPKASPSSCPLDPIPSYLKDNTRAIDSALYCLIKLPSQLSIIIILETCYTSIKNNNNKTFLQPHIALQLLDHFFILLHSTTSRQDQLYLCPLFLSYHSNQAFISTTPQKQLSSKSLMTAMWPNPMVHYVSSFHTAYQ